MPATAGQNAQSGPANHCWLRWLTPLPHLIGAATAAASLILLFDRHLLTTEPAAGFLIPLAVCSLTGPRYGAAHPPPVDHLEQRGIPVSGQRPLASGVHGSVDLIIGVIQECPQLLTGERAGPPGCPCTRSGARSCSTHGRPAPGPSPSPNASPHACRSPRQDEPRQHAGLEIRNLVRARRLSQLVHVTHQRQSQPAPPDFTAVRKLSLWATNFHGERRRLIMACRVPVGCPGIRRDLDEQRGAAACGG